MVNPSKFLKPNPTPIELPNTKIPKTKPNPIFLKIVEKIKAMRITEKRKAMRPLSL